MLRSSLIRPIITSPELCGCRTGRRAAHALRKGAHCVADVQGGEAGPLGMIFMRYRRAEQRHDAIAGELVDRALEPVNAVGNDLEEVLDDTKPLLGIEPFREVHRALDIGEQDGDVLALAFQRGTCLANLVGEVLGRKWRADPERRRSRPDP